MATEILLSHEPVAVPSETVYGLAGLARSPKSLARIFELKARPHFDPLIVHTLGVERVPLFANFGDNKVLEVLSRFWPGPLTVLFERKKNVIPDLCTSGLDEVAVRSPAHGVFREILEGVGQELAAPSANRFGHVSPVSAQDCIKELGPFGLEAVVDGGRSKHGIESSIVRFKVTSKKIEVLRWGACDIIQILKLLGAGWECDDLTRTSHAQNEPVASPGLIENHYAPKRKTLYACEPQWEVSDFMRDYSLNEKQTYVVYCFQPKSVSSEKFYKTRVLSNHNDSFVVAYELFSCVREIDEMEPDLECKNIVFVLPPESSEGLNNAIRDRILRASKNKGKRVQK